jgi:hypothetical protein
VKAPKGLVTQKDRFRVNYGDSPTQAVSSSICPGLVMARKLDSNTSCDEARSNNSLSTAGQVDKRLLDLKFEGNFGEGEEDETEGGKKWVAFLGGEAPRVKVNEVPDITYSAGDIELFI